MPVEDDEDSAIVECESETGQEPRLEDEIEVRELATALLESIKEEIIICFTAILRAHKRAQQAIEEYGMFFWVHQR